MARDLYCDGNHDTLISVADGTYIYCNKSGNFDFQRKTYSKQKLRNFIKSMVVVTTDGYVDVLGPFEATENDAKIMIKIVNAHENE